MLGGTFSCSLHCHCIWSPTIKTNQSAVNSAHVTLWLCMAVQKAWEQLLKSLDQTQECWQKKKKKKEALIYSMFQVSL